MLPIMRVARPTDRLSEIAKMYEEGLELRRLAEFVDHDGFDGIIIGHAACPYHLEFTAQRGHLVGRAPTKDHLLVFYVPDDLAWQNRCSKMESAGFRNVSSYNPYWDQHGRTFEDPDGYRVVIAKQSWERQGV